MSKSPQPKFRSINLDVFEVSLNDVVAGVIVRVGPLEDCWWETRFNDGSRGPSRDTRIDAAWALINS